MLTAMYRGTSRGRLCDKKGINPLLCENDLYVLYNTEMHAASFGAKMQVHAINTTVQRFWYLSPSRHWCKR